MKKFVPYLLIILCVISSVLIGIYFAAPKYKSNKINNLINEGRKYLLELSYEQAIATFNTVISIDAKEERAYLGLADVYVAMAEQDDNYDSAMINYQNALDILEQGYINTGSEEINKRIEEIKEMMQPEPLPEEEPLLVEEEEPEPEYKEEPEYDIYFDFSWEDFKIRGYDLLSGNVTEDIWNNLVNTYPECLYNPEYLANQDFDISRHNLDTTYDIRIIDYTDNCYIKYEYNYRESEHREETGLRVINDETYTALSDCNISKWVEYPFNDIKSLYELEWYGLIKNSGQDKGNFTSNLGSLYYFISDASSGSVSYKELYISINNNELILMIFYFEDVEDIIGFKVETRIH